MDPWWKLPLDLGGLIGTIRGIPSAIASLFRQIGRSE